MKNLRQIDETVAELLKQAMTLFRAGQYSDAEKLCQQALDDAPDNGAIFCMLGQLAMAQGQGRDAAVLYRRATALAPDMLAAWIGLARAFADAAAFDDAIEAVRHAIELDSGSVLPWLMAGSYQALIGRHDEAIDAYQSALAIQPDTEAGLTGLGYSLKTIGRQEDAIRAYRQLIEMHPDSGDAYWSLSNLKSVKFETTDIEAMKKQVARSELPEETRIRFRFALGKAYEDGGNYQRAFENYERGNAARRMHERYDAQETQQLADAVINTCDERLMRQAAGSQGDGPVPIFIVGLPRSGSTLIEQILASHSQVDGTRELPDLERLIGKINRQQLHGAAYPDAMRRMSPDELTDLGHEYLKTTAAYRTGKSYFTDKMPNNFRHAGFIKLILPQAKIIDARRHPLDSCFGSYKQLFVKGQSFTYDLLELGDYYLQYRRLMDHWHALLPGFVLDMQYEELIRDPDKHIRRLLEFCGLPWEQGCVEFHQTDRAIDTASSEQVRQPIYTTSLNNWHNYEEQLGELIDTLQPLLKTLPADQRPESLR